MKMLLKEVTSTFLGRSAGSPIRPVERDAPIQPSDRWVDTQGKKSTVKTFVFDMPEKRDRFIQALMSYEYEKRHHATVTFDERNVKVRLATRNIDQVTELDREYASYLDKLYKDINHASSF